MINELAMFWFCQGAKSCDESLGLGLAFALFVVEHEIVRCNLAAFAAEDIGDDRCNDAGMDVVAVLTERFQIVISDPSGKFTAGHAIDCTDGFTQVQR